MFVIVGTVGSRAQSTHTPALRTPSLYNLDLALRPILGIERDYSPFFLEGGRSRYILAASIDVPCLMCGHGQKQFGQPLEIYSRGEKNKMSTTSNPNNEILGV